MVYLMLPLSGKASNENVIPCIPCQFLFAFPTLCSQEKNIYLTPQIIISQAIKHIKAPWNTISLKRLINPSGGCSALTKPD